MSGLVNNQSLPLGPITFGGTATDNVGLADVQVGIQNRTTLRWWKAIDRHLGDHVHLEQRQHAVDARWEPDVVVVPVDTR